MELTDKRAFVSKTFAAAKQAHDEAVSRGAKCGSQCGIFHKAATPAASKNYTLDSARALMFLLDLGRDIR